MTTVASVYASGLVKRFGELRAVDGIDLEVRQGEIFGVLGPNGAGKTTMLRMLATLLPIDAGVARIFGVDVAREPHRVRQLVGVTGQYASVDEDLTATENLWLFGRLQGLRSGEARATARGLLAQFGLQEAADRPISQFSGGMRRRLDLAASLITRPPLIFLGEPHAVNLGGGGAQPVAGAVAGDHVGAAGGARARDQHLQALQRVDRRLFAPDQLDQLAVGHRPAGVRGQCGQQGLRAVAHHRPLAPADVPEQAQRKAHLASLRTAHDFDPSCDLLKYRG
jgi:ABC-type transport system involved in cytochrome c biogenesis ATPase subunit